MATPYRKFNIISVAIGAIRRKFNTIAVSSGAIYRKFAPINLTQDKQELKEETIGLSESYSIIVSRRRTILSDAEITLKINQRIFSNAHIKSVNDQEIITSDAYITSKINKIISSDAHIKSVNTQEILNSDAYITAHPFFRKNILSDANIVIGNTYNINNIVRIAKSIKSNILNKISFVKRVISDIENAVSFVKRNILDINNKVNTKKQPKYDISNDVRFLASWQRAGDFGFQSLGKSYIKVYINSVEVTDVDVDSINIHNEVNQSKSASFELGRPYDSSKPTIESPVEIKYNNYVLYKGYIVTISPTDNTESIRIECQDEYWKQNKTNKYFFVGHEPTDNQEKYYNTIQEAINAEFAWNVPFGNFVPQTITCFAQGQSECLTDLISQSGNYGWFYDVNGNKKLWQAGSGSIVNLTRQTIGTNLGLYQVIDHRFNENVSEIINKYRVQMGDKTIRSFNNSGGTRSYSGYYYKYYEEYVNPAWDSYYELLENETKTGYGFNHYKPEDAHLYKDVFKKYYLPYLNSEYESWSDRKPPVVIISGTNLAYAKAGVLQEGYSIDYQGEIDKYGGTRVCLILSDAIYKQHVNDKEELTSISRPRIKVKLWKKLYYTYTASPTDNPEEDVTNPLMFFTDKMGDYPDTILKDLDLSSLSIQEGGEYLGSAHNEEYHTYTGGAKTFKLQYTGQTSMIVKRNGVPLQGITDWQYNPDKGEVYIYSSLNVGDQLYFSYDYTGTIVEPSWNDTAFAKDFANWELSKHCDKKISGNISITIDAACLYNIDLSKRIFINGITESPMNILAIDYNINSFTVSLQLENSRGYSRSISLQTRGE